MQGPLVKGCFRGRKNACAVCTVQSRGEDHRDVSGRPESRVGALLSLPSDLEISICETTGKWPLTFGGDEVTLVRVIGLSTEAHRHSAPPTDF